MKKIFSVVRAAIILLSASAVAVSVRAKDGSVILNQGDINQLIEATQSGELDIWSVIYTDTWSKSATDRITTSPTEWVDMPNTLMKIKTEHTIKVQWKVDVPEPDSGGVKVRTLNIVANGAGHL